MKVLFVVSAFPRYPGDVITPWLTETIRHLHARNVEVEVLAPAYRGSADHQVHGIQVHRFRYAPASLETLTHDQTAPDRIRERPAFLGLVPGYVVAGSRAAARLARSGHFNVVHAFWPLPHGLIGLAAKRAAGLPLVSTFFGVELTWMRGQFPGLRGILKRIVRQSDAVTAISSYTARQLAAEVPEAEPAIVPFGAAIAAPPELPACAPRPDRAFEVLFVGRLVERKGVRVLLDAMALLAGDSQVRLRIVGDGPLRGELEKHAAKLRIANRVTFSGAVSQDVLERCFRDCDVFVLPAVVDAKGDTEGLGVVLLEAMVYGKPVIASNTGGIVDIVRDGETGLLVPPGDARALASAIDSLMRAPEWARLLGTRGRDFAADEFSWAAVTERLVGVYRQVTDTAARTRNAR